MAYDWLPELMLMADFQGNWDLYCANLYSSFLGDFVYNKPAFNGLSVNQKRYPESQGKSATFWHIISEGADEEERTPDFRRCERIRWPRAVIDNFSDVKMWENQRKNKTNVCLWIEDEDYLVILRKGNGYYLFWTAYLVTQKHQKRKLEKEYQAFIKANVANQAG